MQTPCYLIRENDFCTNLRSFRTAFSEQWKGALVFGFSVKTNHLPSLMELARQEGMLAEVVSDDEFDHALAQGFPEDAVIYNGVQKTRQRIARMLVSGGYLNLDNLDEIDILEQLHPDPQAVRVQLGLRINFDLEALCPGQTTAGSEVSRFGLCVENGDFARAVERLHKLGLTVSGLHLHFSSKSRSLDIYRSLAQKAARLIEEFRLAGELRFIDVGGGFFLGKNVFSAGKPSLEQYARVICDSLAAAVPNRNVTLILEPGAALISTAVSYYSRVLHVRRIRDARVATLDGTSLEINPFQVKRSMAASVETTGYENRPKAEKQIVAGATCMEADRFSTMLDAPALEKGDLLRFDFAGAYTMCFNNCFINLTAFVYYQMPDGSIRLVRQPRQGQMGEI